MALQNQQLPVSIPPTVFHSNAQSPMPMMAPLHTGGTGFTPQQGFAPIRPIMTGPGSFQPQVTGLDIISMIIKLIELHGY